VHTTRTRARNRHAHEVARQAGNPAGEPSGGRAQAGSGRRRCIAPRRSGVRVPLAPPHGIRATARILSLGARRLAGASHHLSGLLAQCRVQIGSYRPRSAALCGLRKRPTGVHVGVLHGRNRVSRQLVEAVGELAAIAALEHAGVDPQCERGIAVADLGLYVRDVGTRGQHDAGISEIGRGSSSIRAKPAASAKSRSRDVVAGRRRRRLAGSRPGSDLPAWRAGSAERPAPRRDRRSSCAGPPV